MRSKLHFMKNVHKSVLIWYSPQEMFSLVTDVVQYPRFLPWCDQARIVQQEASGMVAEVGIFFSGVRQSFTTRNIHIGQQRIDMQLIQGPFSNLTGQWNFLTLGDGSQRACKVELNLQYGFDNATLAKLVGPVFDKIASSMVDAFVKRAQQVYGD